MSSRANRGAARQRDRRVARAARQRDRRAAKKRDKLNERTDLVLSMPPLKSKVTYFVTDTRGWVHFLCMMYSILPPYMLYMYFVPELRKLLYTPHNFGITSASLKYKKNRGMIYGPAYRIVARRVFLVKGTEFLDFVYDQVLGRKDRKMKIKFFKRNDYKRGKGTELFMRVIVKNAVGRNKFVIYECGKPSLVVPGSKVAKLRTYYTSLK